MDQQLSPMAQVPQPAPDSHAKDVEETKDLAALSYAWILAVFIFIYRRDSAFVKFHARQGIVLFVLSILFWMAPYPMDRILMIVLLVGSAFGFYSASQGQWRELPIVYALSRGNPRLLFMSLLSIPRAIPGLWRRVRNRAGKKEPTKAESVVNQSAPNITPIV